jgi:hypothetical protein
MKYAVSDLQHDRATLLWLPTKAVKSNAIVQKVILSCERTRIEKM